MRTCFFILLFFCYSLLYSQKVTITGNIKNPKEQKVFVGYYANELSYDITYIDSAIIDNQGDFLLQFIWTKPGPARFFHGDEMTQMYLFPRDSFSLRLDTDSFDETLQYQYASLGVNSYFAKKYLLFENVDIEQFMNYNSPETIFLAKTDSIQNVMLSFLNEFMLQFSDNEKSLLNSFYLYEKAEIIYARANEKISYPFRRMFLRRPKNENIAEIVISYDELSEQYYNFKTYELLYNENAFESEAYRSFIYENISSLCKNEIKKDSSKTYSALMEDFIVRYYSGKTKEYLDAKAILQLIDDKKAADNIDLMFDRFKSFCTQKNYIEYVESQINLYKSLKNGSIAPDFEFTDLEGKLWKLSELKGKVVYLDFWASWCKPCLVQIPYAKKLKDDLEGKDIVFLYISIDTDTKSWKETIELKQISGFHGLVNGGFSSFATKQYQVNGIPHYFIIGKDGKIIDNNAKRPSENIKRDLLDILEDR
jgi:thiol-disulfide isomerase/thioredoxin